MIDRKRRFSVGWTFVSFTMIAGGFVLAAVPAVLTEINDEWLGQAVFFVGAFAGGFFAGRASPGRTVAEPGLAGVLFILTVFGLLALAPGARALHESDGQSLERSALEMAFLAGLGGFVGGMIGERTHPREPSVSAFRWWGISVLINIGMTALVLAVFAVLLLRSSPRLLDDMSTGLAVGSFALGALGGGFATQAVAPRRMPWACGAGPLGSIGSMLVPMMAIDAGESATGAIGLGVVAAIATIIGAIGASLGWAFIGSRRAADSTPENGVPRAELR